VNQNEIPGGEPSPERDTADLRPESGLSALDAYMESAAPNAHPRSIGRWKVLEVLGEGGMGLVYLAEQTEPVRRRVALKLIKLGMDTREVLARFDRERQALAMMDHPNIARVLDAGAAEDGRPYFVMELVKGLPLTEYCDRNSLPLKERLALFEQVCHAVQHAHHKGIIHRDLKPSNILVSSSAEAPLVKIIDFGVARAVERAALDRSVYTELGQMIGTPAYMSPEQADMTSEDVDTRSDIYSLGVVLYELLVGAAPFDPATLRRSGFDAMRRMIREVVPPAPSTRLRQLREDPAGVAGRRRSTINFLVREIRGDLDWITLKALEKDRTRRYATASELATDVRRYLTLEPILARRPGALYRLRMLVRRRRGVFIGACAAALVMVFTAAAVKLAADRSIRETAAARSRSLQKEGESALAEHLRRSEAAARLEERLKALAIALPHWAPVWERIEELDSIDELARARRDAEMAASRAERSLTAAIEAAARGSPEEASARRSLEDLFANRYRRGEPGGGGGARISIASEPPGARVHCFRYIPSEGRLLPVPFDTKAGKEDPKLGLLPPGPIRVRRVADAASPFAPGDRFREVAGTPIGSLGDLAKALAAVEVDGKVKVKLERGGEQVAVDWTPFPARRDAPDKESLYAPGRLVQPFEQLGLDLDAYPLDFPERSLLGTAGPGRPVEAELPAGSYLLVLRLEGYLDARFPVAVPETAGAETVRLFKESEVPPGFVPIPAGPVACGGDPEAFQSLDRATVRLPGFFMARFELTTGEYLEFVNDPEVSGRTDDDGTAAPEVETVVQELRDQKNRRIQLIPPAIKNRAAKTLWAREGGAWKLPMSWKPERPMLAIPQFAALEYAAWRTKREPGRWRYRLPTDLEWEKAARGVDRRHYVWGDVLVWSFCWSSPGIKHREVARPPDVIGASPFDESVFGVRDLAGSVAEHTVSRPLAGLWSTTVRGGQWLVIDPQYFRVASRNTLEPTTALNSSGIRLVAERIGD
jgi:formylglycine-generating enzyme required for sulfatase activity